MTIQSVLLPLFVQVVLTFVLLFWAGHLRVGAVRRGEVHPRDIALREPNWGKRETKVANAYHNQLELPVLFYVLTILAMDHAAGRPAVRGAGVGVRRAARAARRASTSPATRSGSDLRLLPRASSCSPSCG